MRPSIVRPTVLAFVLLSAAIAAPAREAPRDESADVAAAIEANYFDADRGRRIADDLRAAAARGTFDALADPRDLAAALSARLKPLDRHFRVRAPGDADAPGAQPRRRGTERDDDDGIREVGVLAGNVGYLRLDHFADFEFGQADAPARRAIEAALARLAGTSATIVDLRGNRGGSPRMVGFLVSAFVPRDAAVYNTFRTRAGAQSEAPLERYPAPRTTVPLYVLIDARTGSAAEAFAYTLKNARRATLVGETSGGAANPGREIATADGFAVFVPTGSPVSPITGTNWEGVGVAPDVAAPSAEALDVALALARKPAPAQAGGPARGAQAERPSRSTGAGARRSSPSTSSSAGSPIAAV